MRIDEYAVETADPADVAEQQATLDGPNADGTGARTELPLEADPVDVVEQDEAVPFDDEER